MSPGWRSTSPRSTRRGSPPAASEPSPRSPTGSAPGRLSSRADQLLRAIEHHDEPALRAIVLGAFAVTRDGDIVPNTAWQSRKARDLFKMLLTRRGRPLAREQAMDRLWPDDRRSEARQSSLGRDRRRCARCSIPDKRFDAEYFVKADGDSLRVDIDHVELDVDRFLVAADAALVEHRRGDGEAATGMLAAAEAMYTGDVLEDDPYVDWHVSLQGGGPCRVPRGRGGARRPPHRRRRSTMPRSGCCCACSSASRTTRRHTCGSSGSCREPAATARRGGGSSTTSTACASSSSNRVRSRRRSGDADDTAER